MPVSLPLLVSTGVAILVAVLVLFALAIVFAAIWYHLRQPKEIRLDADEEDEDFVERD